MSNATMASNARDDEWKQAQGKAWEAAADVGEMAGHAASAVGAMASQAACDAGRKADELTASAGVGIQGLGDRLSKSGPQAGVLGSASQAMAKSVFDGGVYMEDAKLSGMTEDVARLIRRNPIPAVLIAIGVGWCVASRLRS